MFESVTNIILSGSFSKAFWGGAFLTAIAWYMLKHTLCSSRDFEASKTWPSVEGKITRSKAVRYHMNGTLTTWELCYEYAVRGKPYKGGREALYTLTRDEILIYVDKYPVGSTVSVLYRPDNPSESILISGGRDTKKYGEIIGSAFAVVIGIVIMVAGYFGGL